jgi:hypothetical protein
VCHASSHFISKRDIYSSTPARLTPQLLHQLYLYKYDPLSIIKSYFFAQNAHIISCHVMFYSVSFVSHTAPSLASFSSLGTSHMPPPPGLLRAATSRPPRVRRASSPPHSVKGAAPPPPFPTTSSSRSTSHPAPPVCSMCVGPGLITADRESPHRHR